MLHFLQSLDYYHWLLLGLLLLVLEILTGGAFLAWVGFAALVTGLLVLMAPWVQLSLGWQGQLIVFGVCVLLACLAWWRLFLLSPEPEQEPDKLSPGQEFCLDEPLENGRGSICLQGQSYSLIGPNLPKGTRVKVVDVDQDIAVIEALGYGEGGE